MKNSIKITGLITMIWAVLIVFISCEKDTTELPAQETQEAVDQEKIVQEKAFPGQQGIVETIQLYGQTVKVEKINGQYILDGDMIVVPDDVAKSTGRTNSFTRWPDNIVYYEIQNGFPNQQRITDAIADWEAKTPIRFVLRTNQNNYVFFRTGGGCSSFVGRQGGRQDITLAGGCPTGAVIHEIGHAVGLWHEQSRKDRDQYLTINFENIENGLEFNFETYLEQGIDGDEFTNELDFNSIMLYSSFAFSKNGLPTIVKKDGSTYTTNRTSLSNGDVEGIQKMYSDDGPVGGICDGVAEWSPNQAYQPGDRVTYLGNLFERTTTGWSFIGSCETSNTKSSDTDFKDLNDVDPY